MGMLFNLGGYSINLCTNELQYCLLYINTTETPAWLKKEAIDLIKNEQWSPKQISVYLKKQSRKSIQKRPSDADRVMLTMTERKTNFIMIDELTKSNNSKEVSKEAFKCYCLLKSN